MAGDPEDPMEGRSGRPIPAEYGETGPYYWLFALICLPSALLAAILATAAPAAWARAAAQLGAAYAFGSNVWLLRYGPRMFKLCKEHCSWLGKEAFSTIQAACFPEFFALQISGCLLALGGRLRVAGLDLAASLALAALVLGLVNILVLGPISMPLMLKLYSAPQTGTSSKDEALLPAKEARKKFGMVHGISMLVDLVALAFTAAYIVVSAVDLE